MNKARRRIAKARRAARGRARVFEYSSVEIFIDGERFEGLQSIEFSESLDCMDRGEFGTKTVVECIVAPFPFKALLPRSAR